MVDLVDSGKYSAIVFDTAPTGHTLKLLGLPKVLQVGLKQLSSWKSKLWEYYEMFAAFAAMEGMAATQGAGYATSCTRPSSMSKWACRYLSGVPRSNQ